jgi:hypothetical protein
MEQNQNPKLSPEAKKYKVFCLNFLNLHCKLDCFIIVHYFPLAYKNILAYKKD